MSWAAAATARTSGTIWARKVVFQQEIFATEIVSLLKDGNVYPQISTADRTHARTGNVYPPSVEAASPEVSMNVNVNV